MANDIPIDSFYSQISWHKIWLIGSQSRTSRPPKTKQNKTKWKLIRTSILLLHLEAFIIISTSKFMQFAFDISLNWCVLQYRSWLVHSWSFLYWSEPYVDINSCLVPQNYYDVRLGINLEMCCWPVSSNIFRSIFKHKHLFHSFVFKEFSASHLYDF